MKLYITGSFAIAPNFDVNKGVNLASSPAENEYFQAKEPDYKAIIDPKLSRRMARIIKMAIAAASKSLEEAKVKELGAIVVGTGLGCLQDTEKFLADVVQNNENLPSPTAFIQSTHNTIAGQIALVLNCFAHNFTFVQRGHSFECALEDAFLQLEEGTENVLLGGIDEVTPSLFKILYQSGCFGKLSENRKDDVATQRPILGEGASFFVLSGQESDIAKACVEGMDYFFKTDGLETIEERIQKLLQSVGMDMKNLSAVMLGKTGGQEDDSIYDILSKKLFAAKPVLSFKNICGEYFTASAFAMYLAAEILHSQKIPEEILISEQKASRLENILIYNHHQGNYHSLILLSRCRPL